MIVAFALVLAVVAGALAGIRWLRVAQREHYLVGSTIRFAFRWWGRDLLHLALVVLALLAAALEPVYHGTGLVTAAIVGLGPFGLTLRGRTSRLIWTRRLATVAATTGIASALVIALAAVGGLAAAATAAAVVAVVLPLIVDAGLFALRPYEDRRAEVFVRKAAARLARAHPLVVAITGSYGKTTTKGYVAHLLAGRFAVLASPRSYNNRAGLARTVNEQLVPGTEVLVAEMGTYGPGEIAAMCSWMAPRVAVITAIGPVHLERFGDLERTVAAKAEITTDAAVVVLNVDDERLALLADELSAAGRSVTRCSGRWRDADVAVIASGDELELVVGGSSVGTVALEGDAPGALTNVACAVGAALGVGLSSGEVIARLVDLPIAANRLRVSTSEGGVVVIDDTFNANPAGARLALERLAALGDDGAQRVVVTPGMVELGPLQFAENASFAGLAAKGADTLVIVGATNRRSLRAGADHAPSAAEALEVVEVATREQAVDWVRHRLNRGDVVLYENDLPDHYP